MKIMNQSFLEVKNIDQNKFETEVFLQEPTSIVSELLEILDPIIKQNNIKVHFESAKVKQ